MRYSIKINDVEIGLANGAGPNLVLEGTKIELDRENINSNLAKILVPNAALSYANISTGDYVVIKRGLNDAEEKTIFTGDIKSIEETGENISTITVTDPLQRLKYTVFTTSYDRNIDPQQGELSEIFKDIAEKGGFSVSRVRSGIGPGAITTDKFKSNDDSRLNRLNLIQKILNWVFFFDYQNGWVRLEPKGFVSYPNTLIVGQNVKNIPSWQENIEPMRNKIKIDGARQLDTRVDSFVGDGTNKDFTLSFSPESIETQVNGVLKVLGKVGSSEGFDYTLDKDLKRISFETAPPNTHVVNVTYTAFVPTPVKGSSPESIERYNGLIQEEKYKFNDVVTVDDAEVRLKQLLEILQFGIYNTTIFTDEYDVQVGNRVTFQNPENNRYDGNYVVEKKIINYAEAYDVLKIGNPKIDLRNIFITIDERLRLLEGDDQVLSELLRNLISLTRKKPRYFRKSLKLEKRNMTDTFIANHQTLSWARSGLDREPDCSGNGNAGTWVGTDVTTGDQYLTSSESAGVITTPVQRLGCAVFNGTDRKIITTGVNETGIRSVAFFIKNYQNDAGFMILNTGKTISINSNGEVTSSGFTGNTIEQEALPDGVDFVYIEFDSETMNNPEIGTDGVSFFDGLADELMVFNDTLTEQDKDDLKQNFFYKQHPKFNNCKLWFAFDNPKAGDRRTAYITVVNEEY